MKQVQRVVAQVQTPGRVRRDRRSGIGDRGSGIGDRGSQRDRRSGDRRSRRDRRSEDRGSRRDRRSRIFQTCNREMSHPKATQVPQNSWGIAEGSEGSQRDRRSEDRGSQRDRRSEDRRSRFRDRRSATNRRALFRVDLCNHGSEVVCHWQYYSR